MRTIKRIQHPVGQGCFYEETHELTSESNSTSTKTFRFVYDCGSSTRKGRVNALSRAIGDLEGKTINALFISHFHADHVNGLKELATNATIKTVFLPYLDEAEKIILSMEAIVRDDQSDISYDIITNPEGFFGDATIIRVTPSDEDSRERDQEIIEQNQFNESPEQGTFYFDDESGLKIIGSQTSTESIACTTPIHIGHPQNDIDHGIWQLLTFVPQKSNFADKLLKALEDDAELEFSRDIILSKPSHLIESWLSEKCSNGKSRISHLKTVFDYTLEIGTTHNRISMCLYSGPKKLIYKDSKNSIDITTPRYNVIRRKSWRQSRLHVNRFPFDDSIGWIGTGDQEFKDKAGNLSEIGQEFKRHYKKVTDQIRLILVPHHGAKSNYHSELLGTNDICHIISCGSQDCRIAHKYGHPAPSTLIEILSKCNSEPFIVTEKTLSSFIEIITFMRV